MPDNIMKSDAMILLYTLHTQLEQHLLYLVSLMEQNSTITEGASVL